MTDTEKNEKDGSEIGMIDLLAILIRKRWIWIIALSAGIALVLVLKVVDKGRPTESPSYTTAVKVLVVDPMINSRGGDRSPSSGNMAAAVATSSEIAQKVGNTLGERSGKEYAEEIKASYDSGSGVLMLAITTKGKTESQNLAKAGAEATIDYMKEITAQHYAGGMDTGSVSNPAIVPQFKIIDLKTQEAASGLMISTKKAIIIILAALFLGILAAFIADAWDNVRKDPEAMKKLEDAKKAK